MRDASLPWPRVWGYWLWFSVVAQCVTGPLVILPGHGRGFRKQGGSLEIQNSIVIPQVTFEEDFRFWLDRVAGLLSESRWYFQGLLLLYGIPGAVTWSGNALCQLGPVFSWAPKHWGTQARNYSECLVLMFKAFLSQELSVTIMTCLSL